MKDFTGKVVVVTGGATGIGLALAKQFGAKGAKLVLAARRRNRLDQAASELSATGVEVRTFECDVTQRDQVEALADFAWKEFGTVDVIVNNAGHGSISSPVIEAKHEDVQRLFDVNVFGVWNGAAVFGRRFLDRGTPAAIYNVGSENSLFGSVICGAGYVASKHACLALTMALREEVPPFIDVGLICPGLVRSDLAIETVEGMDTDRYAELVMKQIVDGQFFIVSHSYNAVRIDARYNAIKEAYATYAPRYPGDVEFDVRILGAKRGWYPPMPDKGQRTSTNSDPTVQQAAHSTRRRARLPADRLGRKANTADAASEYFGEDAMLTVMKIVPGRTARATVRSLSL
jgi:NAD(P)-dependent dehydrogenase (short-subunit alcohol dehydrogenase family)